MRPYAFGWPVWASIALHGVAVVAAATVTTFPPSSHREPIVVEIVRLDARAPARPESRKPARREPITAPRPVTEPTRVIEPTPAPRPVTEPTRVIEPAPAAPALLNDAPKHEGAAPVDAGHRVVAGATSSSVLAPPGALEANSRGDLPVAGPPGSAGSGSIANGDGKRVIASKGDSDGLTSFARPVGGYQTRPRYPDSARRHGIEGETLLRFQVLSSGRVASISVARSAGHPDLDRSAVEAVQTWLFEPARRGREAVAIWVTLPVRFQLRSRAGE